MDFKDLVLPLAVLLVFAALFAVVLFRLEGSQITDLFRQHALPITALLLFLALAILSLGTDAEWTGDVLKVLAGAVIGGGAASTISATSQTAIGERIQQAGRDIIASMQGDIGELKDSVVNLTNATQLVSKAMSSGDVEEGHPIRMRQRLKPSAIRSWSAVSARQSTRGQCRVSTARSSPTPSSWVS
jgi:hypothetical protein